MNDKMKPIYCLAIVYESGQVYIDSTVKTEVQLSGLLEVGAKASIRRVKVIESDSRSLDANGLYHVWIKQLGAEVGNDVITQEAELKINFGFSILFQDPELGPQLTWILKRYTWDQLTWEQQVKMAKWIPVTRLMATKQMRQYMENIKNWAEGTMNMRLDNGKRD